MLTRLLVAGLAVALTMASAHAQMNNSQMPGGSQIGTNASRSQPQNSDTQKVKADDKAYNSALRNLPNKQYDPWRGVR